MLQLRAPERRTPGPAQGSRLCAKLVDLRRSRGRRLRHIRRRQRRHLPRHALHARRDAGALALAAARPGPRAAPALLGSGAASAAARLERHGPAKAAASGMRIIVPCPARARAAIPTLLPRARPAAGSAAPVAPARVAGARILAAAAGAAGLAARLAVAGSALWRAGRARRGGGARLWGCLRRARAARLLPCPAAPMAVRRVRRSSGARALACPVTGAAPFGGPRLGGLGRPPTTRVWVLCLAGRGAGSGTGGGARWRGRGVQGRVHGRRPALCLGTSARPADLGPCPCAARLPRRCRSTGLSRQPRGRALRGRRRVRSVAGGCKRAPVHPGACAPLKLLPRGEQQHLGRPARTHRPVRLDASSPGIFVCTTHAGAC